MFELATDGTEVVPNGTDAYGPGNGGAFWRVLLLDSSGAVFSSEVAGSSSPTATVPAGTLADGPGTRTVRGRVQDKDGGFTNHLTTITTTNLAPTASGLAAGGATYVNNATTFTLTASDPSPVDPGAPFTFVVDRGDATETITAPCGTVVTHTYSSLGTFTARVPPW